MRTITPITPRRQRGAAALVVTMALFFIMLLVAMFANRNLVFEQRTSANQYRSTQAFEAAEAGLEWALAQLNNNQHIGADCLPSTAAGVTSFRERYLSYQRDTSTFAPATWNNAGVAAPLQPSCVRTDSGWACGCPAQGLPNLSALAGNGSFPAFSLLFLAAGKPGIVRVVATGCTSLAGACVAGTGSSTDATARVEVALGLVSGLGTAPVAPLTARAAVNINGAIGVHNPDASSGAIAIHSGGVVAAPLARVTTVAGSSAASAVVSQDAGLAGLSPDQLFAAYFGLDKAGWKSQPTVQPVSCNGNCSEAMLSAIGAGVVNPLIWVGGDLTLDGPITLGTPQRPVVIVAAGAAQLNAAVTIHGVVYSAAMSWNNTAGPGALLRGAAIVEGAYQGNGAPDLVYDRDLLAALRGNSGSFTRINGSWRDF
jgi:PilX N-terminal